MYLNISEGFCVSCPKGKAGHNSGPEGQAKETRNVAELMMRREALASVPAQSKNSSLRAIVLRLGLVNVAMSKENQ
ncbi:MAG: hypothetical protein KGI75_22570 [Rhizobiaceae bacterium]|nr:hypothetical protein [Rhizobiaceae bacterium]